MLFDTRARRVYPLFLNYETMDDARADVQRIAKALGISEKAVGGHLCQASSNPKVTSGLRNMGYDDSQIPDWFQRPREATTPTGVTPVASSQPQVTPHYAPAPPRLYDPASSWGEGTAVSLRGYVESGSDSAGEVTRLLYTQANTPDPSDILMAAIREQEEMGRLLDLYEDLSMMWRSRDGSSDDAPVTEEEVS